MSFLWYNSLKCNLFLWCKAEFSASFLQSSESHDPSEINLIYWFADHNFFFQLLKLKIGEDGIM